jgi:hypothetical protein
MNDPDWQATLTKAIADPGTKISVALDNVGGASTFGRVMGGSAASGFRPGLAYLRMLPNDTRKTAAEYSQTN